MQAAGFTPERILPDERTASTLGFLRAIARDPVSAVPAAAFEELTLHTTRGGDDFLFVCDPALLEEILVRRSEDFPKSEVDRRILGPALGQSLLTAQGEDWRWKRRLAAPYFAPAALKRSVGRMAAPFEALAQGWRAGGAPRSVEVSGAMTAATLEVIARTLFETADEMDTAPLSRALVDYLEPVSWAIAYASLGFPEWLPHPGKARWRRGRRAMRRWMGEVVRARRREGAERDDICGQLMAATDPETGRPLSDEDLVDMLLTLVAAGHETSANSLTWAIYCLARQPGVQAGLRAEVLEVAGEREIGPGDLPRLARTEAFIRETMRLFPAAPLMSRMTRGEERFAGETFAPGTVLFIPVYAIHRHRRLWTQPDRFEPERFLGQTPARTTFMPFGAGPRVCVGGTFAMMEMVAGLATMLRRVSFAPNARTVCQPVQRITLRPKNGLQIDVSPA